MTTLEAAGIFQLCCRQIGLLLSGRKSDVIFLASFYSLERLCSPKKGLLVRPDWKRPTSIGGRRCHFLFYDFDGEGGRGGGEQQQPRNGAFGEKE